MLPRLDSLAGITTSRFFNYLEYGCALIHHIPFGVILHRSRHRIGLEETLLSLPYTMAAQGLRTISARPDELFYYYE